MQSIVLSPYHVLRLSSGEWGFVFVVIDGDAVRPALPAHVSRHPSLVRRVGQLDKQCAPGTHQLPIWTPRGLQHQRRPVPVFALGARADGEGSHHGVYARVRTPRHQTAGTRTASKQSPVQSVSAVNSSSVSSRVMDSRRLSVCGTHTYIHTRGGWY